MDEEPKKVKKKKKKVKKIVVSPPTDEGGKGPGEDDALSAFGIKPREGSSYKAAAGLAPRPKETPVTEKDGPEGGPEKVVVKKVKKKKVRKVRKVVSVPTEADGVPKEKVEVTTKVVPKVTPPTKPIPKVEKPVVAKGPVKDVAAPKVEGGGDFEKAEELLDDIDLDKLTESIGTELLEKFEEKIDNILDDFMDGEVEELTKVRTDVEDVEEKDTEVEIPAHAKDGKAEVESRPELKLEVESPVKSDGLDEEVLLEKEETKMVSEEARPEKEIKPVTKAETQGIRIEEGDVRQRRVAYKVAHNFDKLPPNMRNELLKTLSKVDDPRVREDVVSAIATHFKNLPPEIQALLTNLARDEVTRVREEVVFEIQRNFKNLSIKIKERILKALVLDKEPSVREEVMSTICQHYNELSPDVKELLKTLAKDKERSVRDELSFEMVKADSPVPKEVREDILAILKGKR
jgi:hypothetical protein